MLDVVRHVWGWTSLRPLQLDAITATAYQRDWLLVLPTGGGKSLCYQVPPLLDASLHVVVSPLIALMKDQVDALQAVGYPAGALYADQDAAQRQAVEQALGGGQLRLLFVSPERMMLPGFAARLQDARVRSVTIDEAHCISQWGHDFRPEYRQLGQLRGMLGDVSLHACTATATERVQQDIVEQLGLRDPVRLVGQLDRPNLLYRVQPRVDKYAQVHEALSRHKGQAAIVYCPTRKSTEAMAQWLSGKGFSVDAYHAGLDPDTRRAVHEAFTAERLNVVAATVAFGMGIDRGDVRCVVHAGMPASIEAWQQESGRAGRDGLPAECVLLWSGADAARWNSLAPEGDPARAALLDAMTGFCSTAQCRRAVLARHFGATAPESNCGQCDVCLGEVSLVHDGDTIARKILSAVARLDQRYGIGHVVNVLRGSVASAVVQRGHDRLSVHGLLRHVDTATLTNLCWQCVHLGLLQRTADEWPVIQLTTDGRAVMMGERQAQLVAPPGRPIRAFDNHGKADPDLLRRLRSVRRTLAASHGVPAYVVFNDVSLRAMAQQRPATKAELLGIEGIGDHRVDRWGDAILEAIAS